MLGGAGSPGGDDLLTVTVARDEHGYGMKVSGDNPVYVQSVKEHGAAWRAGLRAGDRILRVDSVPVHHHTHQQVVHMIRANPTTVLTVQQNASRHKTPITAPVPVNPEKQRQMEMSKVQTMRLMLEKEQTFIRDLRIEISKVPDVRKQVELQSAEQRCAKLQREIDTIMAGQSMEAAPSTPRLTSRKPTEKSPSPLPNTGFLSGLPRSLSNLTGQSLRNLRNKMSQENTPPLVRQNSDESNNKRRHVHNNTVPMVPTTCLDNVTPPPLPPRSIERPKRDPLSPTMSPTPINPLAMNKPYNSASPSHKQYYKGRHYPDKFPMHQSMPSYNDEQKQFRRSSHSLDGELDGPQPNSIALQMSYPLVNVPPPPLQTDNRTGVPVLHVRSRSSPEQLDHDLVRSMCPVPHGATSIISAVRAPLSPARECMSGVSGLSGVSGVSGVSGAGAWGERDTPPPGTPPPPYHTNTQPCSDPQRAIISMEEDDSPASDNSTYLGLFSNLRAVRESKARTAVLLNWLLGERRCACACLLLVLTDGYRSASGVQTHTLRRWAYEIHSTFLVPNAVLQLSGVDENMANEIEHVLVNEYEKEELLRNVFRKARQKAKDELSQQLTEFQVKRQVGLGTLYGPEDAVIDKCDVDKAQELIVVEQLMCGQLRTWSRGGRACPGARHAPPAAPPDAHHTLLAALIAAALCLQCRPASVAAAVGGARPSFLQRDKLYKQRFKQITKQHQQPFVVRGHHLQLQALTSVSHCHVCQLNISGLAPQAYVCADCKLCVHRGCTRSVDEGCCLDGEHHNNRISRFMDRIHHNSQPTNMDSSDKKSRKASNTGHFLQMERSFRKAEDDASWDATLTPSSVIERRDESDESLYESADGHSDAISASDDALPRLSKTPTISKESLKLAVTDEEVDCAKIKKTHRKTMSLSNPLEIVRNLGDEWFESAKKDLEKNSDKKKSKESLWSEEDRDSIHGSTMKLDQIRKNSKKEDKTQSNSRKSSTNEAPKIRKPSKGSSVGGLGFFRRKKTPTSTKPVESVAEDAKVLTLKEIINYTQMFLEGERRLASICEARPKPPIETDSEEEAPTPKLIAEHRRRLSRQTSRSKSKARGKSQSLKVNTLRKSHSGTLKKGKKKSVKATPSIGRSRQASIVEQTPIPKKKTSESMKHNSWLFSGARGESRREGSTDEPTAPDADVDTSDANTKEPDKDNNWRSPAGRGVNRAESCRERDAPRRGKHRNASDPNRLTAHNNHDLEPGAATAPSGSSSSSSLSSRSNESNTVAADQQATQSDWSEEDEPLAAQWSESLPPTVLSSLVLCAKVRKRQEVIHELIVSEGSHLRWLRVLGNVFLEPLELSGLLAPEELRSLFPNLPTVRDHHARLYADLRAARSEAPNHVVPIRPIADALLNTLGDSGYASSVSLFCRGQRMALDALRERRRKSKELQQFLARREQLQVCGRLQLKDMLACVWQRLTKYQLLLEGVLKTADSESEDSEDVSVLRKAHIVAKDVLHHVDTSIRTAENEHRLRTIKSKLEIRVAASTVPELEELRRLDLTQHTLRNEGELTLRNDCKKINVLALMLEDSLLLLQREGDKFLLKPFPQPTQQQPLSPLIKWDKVLFRPNAAVRNTFFLMNINGVQMHELSANSAPEYASWVKHIQEAPLAKLTELKASITPSHQASRSTDDSGINVSRNPSDASEKSSSTVPIDEPTEPERPVDRTSADIEEKEKDDNISLEREDRSSLDKEDEKDEKEEKHKVRRPTVGRISTHGACAGALESAAAVHVRAPAALAAHHAHRVYTDQERLRRLDGVINRALRAKSAIVGAALGVPPQEYAHLADLAVHETLGDIDVSGELRLSRGQLSRSNSAEDEDSSQPDLYQLLLAAHAQATQLTRYLQRAMTVTEADTVAARARSGRCDSCHRVPRTPKHNHQESFEVVSHPDELLDPESSDNHAVTDNLEKEISETLVNMDLQDDGTCEESAEDALELSGSGAVVASRVWAVSRGLQAALARALAAAPRADQLRTLREHLAVAREQNDALRQHNSTDHNTNEEVHFPKAGLDPSIQEQPSNGG